MAATQFSIAFFATLLTGEAVIFALTFSAASSWPSLRAIDGHIAFREWVLIGWAAALFTACGLLGDNRVSATYGALLFLLANIFGIFSFVRLFGLASVGGRNRLLCRTLAEAVGRPDMGSAAHDFENGPVVNAYLGAISQAVTSNDPTAVRNLVDQLVEADVAVEAAENAIALHVDVLHRLARAALVSGADPIQATSCAHALVDSVLRLCRTLPEPAPPLGALSRYLAWLADAALLMSVRGVASNRSARELVALSTDARLKILRCVDRRACQLRTGGHHHLLHGRSDGTELLRSEDPGAGCRTRPSRRTPSRGVPERLGGWEQEGPCRPSGEMKASHEGRRNPRPLRRPRHGRDHSAGPRRPAEQQDRRRRL
ncbi:hypothetical protein ABZ642_29075 [Streptomyces sp. NPDC007157]|uniref:hypothetical protein n=1 Tax=Streptomyces sp. NPDC007157 TaxID=3154681 RepID=UPI0033FBDB92